MAKKDMLAEKDKSVDDDVFRGSKDGTPENGPRESGGGAGETTKLASGPKNQYRTAVTDNPGNMPYAGGTNSGKGNTNQDAGGTAHLYDEKSNDAIGDEHEESAADQDVDTYYRELSKRRPPNYSKTMNLQTKQAPLDLAPVDGGEGFIGSETGPTTGFNYITGKKGFSEDVPVWEEVSTFKDYKDNTGSTTSPSPEVADGDIKPSGEDSRDEFATWKLVQGDEGLPQTAFTSAENGGVPSRDTEPDESFPGGSGQFGRMGGRGSESYNTDLNVQKITSDDSGDTDTDTLPQTVFTETDGGGAPLFKFSGQTPPKSLYMPKPRE